jgi:hypothetical protein
MMMIIYFEIGNILLGNIYLCLIILFFFVWSKQTTTITKINILLLNQLIKITITKIETACKQVKLTIKKNKVYQLSIICILLLNE